MVDTLIELIYKHDLGCNFGTLGIGISMYPDDLFLIYALAHTFQQSTTITIQTSVGKGLSPPGNGQDGGGGVKSLHSVSRLL